LNTLEKSAVDISIPDVNGLSRTKYGIFVDNFNSHLLGNSDLEDYACAINFTDGWLQNKSKTVGVKLKPVTNDAGWLNCSVTANKTLLNYIETTSISQPNATKFAPLAEFLYAGFDGNIIMSPESDIWYDVTAAPDIIFIDDNSGSLVPRTDLYSSVVNSQSR
jgi:hypothetical protein